jgi:hypothetical protein
VSSTQTSTVTVLHVARTTTQTTTATPVTVTETTTKTKLGTTLALSCPSEEGEATSYSGTCTATILGGASPTGTVKFTQAGYPSGVVFSGGGCTIYGSGASQYAVCPVSSGSASVTVTGNGNDGLVTITGTYSGDSVNAGSSNTAKIVETGIE